MKYEGYKDLEKTLFAWIDKEDQKYINFYGSKELIQVIIVGEKLQFFLTFRYSLK